MDGKRFLGWVYKHPNGEEIFFFPDQLIRIRLFNPYDWLLGLSPYSSIKLSTLADAKAGELASKYLENSANIGGLLTTESKLNNKQAQDLKAMWQSQYEGFSKAGKTALLHSGLKFEQTSRSLVDLQFKDQKTMNREEIMSAYGCSNTILGLTQTVNRATAQVEKELFWEDTLIPLAQKFWLSINEQWIRFVGKKDLVGVFDTSGVHALKRNQTQKIKDASILIDQGVPPEEAYKTVDLKVDTKSSPWLKEPLVKGTRTNLQTGELLGQQTIPVKEEPSKKELGYTKDDEEEFTDEELEAYWKDYFKATLDIPEKEFKDEWIKFLIKQRNTFQDKVDSWLGTKTQDIKFTKASSDQFMISKKTQDVSISKMADPIYNKTIDLQIKQLDKELNGLEKFINNNAVRLAIKDERQKFLAGINTTTFNSLENKIKILLDQPSTEELSKAELAKKVKKIHSDVFTNKINSAKTIAKTETSSIASDTRHRILNAEQIKKRRWVTDVSSTTRGQKPKDTANHLVLNGQVRKINVKFSNGLLYPLQAGARAEEVVNCNCVEMPIVSKK